MRKEISIFNLSVQDFHPFFIFDIWKAVEDIRTLILIFISEIILKISSDSPSKIHVFLQNCNSICMNGTKLSVFKKSDKISFS